MVSTTEFDHGKGRLRLLMERVPGTEVRYEYFVGGAAADYKSKLSSFPSAAGGTLQKEPFEQEIQRAAADGYALMGMLPRTQIVQRRRGIFNEKVVQVELTLIGERAGQATPAASPIDRYRVLTGAPGVPLQTELSAVAADGYHLVLTSPTAEPALVLIFEKDSGSAGALDYVVVGGMDVLTLNFQLDAAARRGLRAVPGFVLAKPAAVVMEKGRSSEDIYEYVLLEDMDKKEFADSTGCVRISRDC